MVKFVVNHESEAPLYRQLEEQVLYAISVGELRPGDALPSIRELERDLEINRNTARQAYLSLQAKGAIVLPRGHNAHVAKQPPLNRVVLAELTDTARELSHEMLTRCEAAGLDGLAFAEYHARIAAEHDVQHPRCAFFECNVGMAREIALHISGHFRRHIVPVNLRDECALAVLPPSVRVAITPSWHFAETKTLLADSRVETIQVELRLTSACVTELKKLKGKQVLVVVRDAESLPGYRQLLQPYVRAKTVTAVVADEFSSSRSLYKKYARVVFTTPCNNIVKAVVPTGRALELVFEPLPEALDALRRQLFPDWEHVAPHPVSIAE